jgi:DNA-binding transcriptional LysR family regulator
MNFKALRAFTLVMEFGSLAPAAAKLNLSAPAVSRLIGQLETETKLKLFDRTSRGLNPTEAGHLFAKEAQRILADLEELPDVIRGIKRRTFDRLSILTTPRLVPGLVVPALARMSARHPDVKCLLDVQSKWVLEHSLTRNRYDVCAAILPVPNNTLSVRPLYRIAAEALMPANHSLASRTSVTAHDLQHERLIGFLPGQLLRRQLSDLFRNAGIDMELDMEISTSTIAADLTRRGCGIAVVDRLLCSGLNMEGLTTVPFNPPIWTTAGVLFAKNEEPSPAVQRFLGCMQDVLTEFTRSSVNKKIIEVFENGRAARVIGGNERSGAEAKENATTLPMRQTPVKRIVVGKGSAI